MGAKVTRDPADRLDRRTVNEIRRFLEQRRSALMRSVRDVMGRRGAGQPERSVEEAAQATETMIEEVDVAIADRQSRQVAQIEAALESLGRRDYGVCRECNEFIGVARLKALPFAQRCRPCQDRAERAERRYAVPNRGLAATALAEAEMV
jgi:DnaK suppressor protein